MSISYYSLRCPPRRSQEIFVTVSRRKFLSAVFSLVSAGILSSCGNRSDSASETTAAAISPSPNMIKWPDQTRIFHLFFHSLVADPKRAFDGDDEAKGYLDYMVT